jgi:hypothetical protein
VKYFSTSYIKNEQVHISDFKPNLSANSIFTSLNAATRRSSHALILEKVTQKTPSEIPFAEYSPLLDAAINHIPRVLWQSKPKEVRGNWFGQRYFFLHPDDKVTSWNVPWTSEFYLVYGYTKATAISFLLGGMIAVFVVMLSNIRQRAIGFGIFSSSIVPLFYQESNFSLMVGNILTITLFLMFISYSFVYLYEKFILGLGK